MASGVHGPAAMNRTALLLSWGIMGSALAQEGSPPVDEEVPEVERSRFELGVAAGYASSRDYEAFDHAGLGLRVQALVPLASFFTLGAEASLHANAGSQTDILKGERSETRYASLLQLGGTVQLGGDLGRVRPFVQLGAGWFKGLRSGFCYSAGAGLRVHLTPRWSLQGDVRLEIRNMRWGSLLSWGPSLAVGTVVSW